MDCVYTVGRSKEYMHVEWKVRTNFFTPNECGKINVLQSIVTVSTVIKKKWTHLEIFDILSYLLQFNVLLNLNTINFLRIGLKENTGSKCK